MQPLILSLQRRCLPIALSTLVLSLAPALATAAPRGWSAELALQGGQPAGLQTGLAVGPLLGWRGDLLRAGRWRLAAGGQAGWRTATEFTRSYEVRHDEARLAAVLDLQRQHAGGAAFVRAGAGGALVWEVRDRHQAARLGDATATALQTQATAVVPAAFAQFGLAVALWPAWSLAVAVGPVAHWRDTGLVAGAGGWLGVQWQP